MTDPLAIPAIILAAGESRRLGVPKQVIEFQGETLLTRAVRAAREAGARPVLVVLGANADRILAATSMKSAVLVMNLGWEEGIASSIRAGLRAAENHAPEAEAVLLMTCDQPRIGARHLAALLQTFESAGGESIVASFYAGTRGIPAVFPSAVFPQLLALEGDTGARRLLADPPCPVEELFAEGGEFDIDVPDDLALLE
jgi:CTP:molybdopterin cytidylyltransferase MocA